MAPVGLMITEMAEKAKYSRVNLKELVYRNTLRISMNSNL